jgi:hypothetical protein
LLFQSPQLSRPLRLYVRRLLVLAIMQHPPAPTYWAIHAGLGLQQPKRTGGYTTRYDPNGNQTVSKKAPLESGSYTAQSSTLSTSSFTPQTVVATEHGEQPIDKVHIGERVLASSVDAYRHPPFGAPCILYIRGEPSPACPLTSRLLTPTGAPGQPLRTVPFIPLVGTTTCSSSFSLPRKDPTHGPQNN